MSISRRTDYTVAQKVLHWLIAIAIMLDLVIAQKFGGAMEDWDRFESRSDHASVGTLVAALFVVRLYLRLKHGAPSLPPEMSAWQKLMAHLAHWALYLLIAAMILTGMFSAVYANSSVEPFGLFAFGDGAGNADNFARIRNFHEIATKAMIALIFVHIVGALHHLLIVRDGVTTRMLRFWASANPKRGD